MRLTAWFLGFGAVLQQTKAPGESVLASDFRVQSKWGWRGCGGLHTKKSAEKKSLNIFCVVAYAVGNPLTVGIHRGRGGNAQPCRSTRNTVGQQKSSPPSGME